MKRPSRNVAGLAGLAVSLLVITELVIWVQAPAKHTRAQTIRTTAVQVAGSAVAQHQHTIATSPPIRVPTTNDVPIPLPSSAEVPAMVKADDSAAPAHSGTAWITLGTYTVAPGVWTVPLHGAGFAPGERINLQVEGAVERVHASLAADSSGHLDGTAELEVAPNAEGTVHLVAIGSHSHLQASASFGVVPLVATLRLSPYAALPGAPVDVFGQGYAPGEPVDLAVGGKLLRIVRADNGGNLQLPTAFTVQYDAAAGQLIVAATGVLSHHAAWQNLGVEALQPWATASSYAVHPGDHIQFDAHGFAVGEQVAVYAGEAIVGQSNGPADGQGTIGGLGPVTVPSGEQQVVYTLQGKRSGARAAVTISVLQ